MRRFLAAAVLTSLAGAASAAPITYDFTGTSYGAGIGHLTNQPVTLVVPPELDPDTLTFISFSGTVTFDPDAVLDSSSSPALGVYNDAVLALSVQVNGFEFSFDALAGGDAYGYVVVDSNDSTPPVGLPANGIDVRATAFQPTWLASLGNGGELAEIGLSHLTFDLTEIDSDALPSSLDGFGSWKLFVSIYDPQQFQYWQAQSDVQLTRRATVSVPEPGPLALLALGLVAACFTRRGARGAGAPA